jgi:hypothetical protein
MKYSFHKRRIILLPLAATLLFGAAIPACAAEPLKRSERDFEAHGEVHDPAGLRVANALVEIVSASHTVSHTRTDGKGRFQLRTATAGTAAVRVSASGFETSSLQVEFSSQHSRIDLQFSLVIAQQRTVVNVEETAQRGIAAEASQAGTLVLKNGDLAARRAPPR